MHACLLSALLALGVPAEAQLPPAIPEPAGASVDAKLLKRLERLEAELRDVRASKDKEVDGLKSQVNRLQGELEGMRFRPAPQPPPILLFDPADLGEAADQGRSKSGKGRSSDDGDDGSSGTEATATRVAAGSGTMSTSGGGGGGGGGQGSVGRGERTGSRSPAGYKINTEYKYNFAGGYFSLFDDNKEFVANLQNMLVADGTFYGRQQPPSEQVGFNIPFQRLYLYGNITKNWEFQLSEQSSSATSTSWTCWSTSTTTTG